MLRQLISSSIKMRFALWALEMALPSRSDLKSRFRMGLLGVLAATTAGVLLAIGLAALIGGAGYSLYYYMGVSQLWTLTIMVVSSLLLIGGFFLLAVAKIEEACAGFQEENKEEDHLDPIHAVMNGFLEGFKTEPKPAATVIRHPHSARTQWRRS